MSPLRVLLTTSAMLAFAASARAEAAMDWLSIGGKAPMATLYSLTGTGGEEASAKGRVGAPSIKAHCENWSPDDVASCVASTSAEYFDREAEASANCRTGALTSDKYRYRLDGVWTSGVGEGRARFRTEAGDLVDQSSAAGGLMLAQRWEVLCPGPAPIVKVAASATAIGRLEPVEVVDLKSLDGLPYDHNGSIMIADPAKGLIVYAKPKKSIASAVRPGTVLYRGRPWSVDTVEDLPFAGTARVFKKGCPAAVYDVRGMFLEGSGMGQFKLEGMAPVRSKTNCDVVGHATTGANARLTFSMAWD